MEQLCLGCGKITKSGARRVVEAPNPNPVSTLLKNIIESRINHSPVSGTSIIGVLDNVLSNYDKHYHVPPTSGAHSRATYDKDLSIIVREISERSKVFSIVPGRKHATFKSVQMNIIGRVKYDNLKSWMIMHMNFIVNGF